MKEERKYLEDKENPWNITTLQLETREKVVEGWKQKKKKKKEKR